MKWEDNEIPQHHRVKYLEAIKQVSAKIAISRLQREILEFDKNIAIVQTVMMRIKARDQCIKQIEDISQR